MLYPHRPVLVTWCMCSLGPVVCSQPVFAPCCLPRYSSMVISRRRDDPLDRLGSETFVPARYLFGALPDALLAQYQVGYCVSAALSAWYLLAVPPSR